jgi:hypothetical protein
MWQVVTSPQPFAMFADSERGLFGGEIDDLLAVLAAFQPAPLPARQPQNLLPFKARNGTGKTARLPRPDEAVNPLETPRPANAPEPARLPRDVRESLLKLRATIMLAAELQGLRTVLLCGAEPADGTTHVAATLSQLLSEYERLKVAYIEVSEEPPDPMLRRKILPIGYTFQIRRTRKANLYEIASSLGTVRLEDWLRWWNPAVVLQEMNKMFDLVVIHAPAITTNPEVALLAAAADGVILVATENVTSYASIDAAHKRLRAANARILGVTMQQEPAAPSVTTRVREFIAAMVKK